MTTRLARSMGRAAVAACALVMVILLAAAARPAHAAPVSTAGFTPSGNPEVDCTSSSKTVTYAGACTRSCGPDGTRIRTRTPLSSVIALDCPLENSAPEPCNRDVVCKECQKELATADLTILNGYAVVTGTHMGLVDEQVVFKCNPGYVLSTTQTFTCRLQTGRNEFQGELKTTGSAEYVSVDILTGQSRYRFQGDFHTGNTLFSKPSCIRLPTGLVVPPAPLNGFLTVVPSDSIVGSTVTVTPRCYAGFTLWSDPTANSPPKSRGWAFTVSTAEITGASASPPAWQMDSRINALGVSVAGTFDMSDDSMPTCEHYVDCKNYVLPMKDWTATGTNGVGPIWQTPVPDGRQFGGNVKYRCAAIPSPTTRRPLMLGQHSFTCRYAVNYNEVNSDAALPQGFAFTSDSAPTLVKLSTSSIGGCSQVSLLSTEIPEPPTNGYFLPFERTYGTCTPVHPETSCTPPTTSIALVQACNPGYKLADGATSKWYFSTAPADDKKAVSVTNPLTTHLWPSAITGAKRVQACVPV